MVNTNGGNTSAKLREVDPVTGEKVTVLWVKGSGCDLRTCAPQNFASLYQDRILALEKIRPTLECEDDVVPLYAHHMFGLCKVAPSIDTPLVNPNSGLVWEGMSASTFRGASTQQLCTWAIDGGAAAGAVFDKHCRLAYNSITYVKSSYQMAVSVSEDLEWVGNTGNKLPDHVIPVGYVTGPNRTTYVCKGPATITITTYVMIGTIRVPAQRTVTKTVVGWTLDGNICYFPRGEATGDIRAFQVLRRNSSAVYKLDLTN